MKIPEKLKYISEKIGILRQDAGLSQKDLAERTDLTPSYISQVERGLIVPSLQVLLKISDIFGISFEEMTRDHNTVQSIKRPLKIKDTRKIFDFFDGVSIHVILEEPRLDIKILHAICKPGSKVQFNAAFGAYGTAILNKGELICNFTDKTNVCIKEDEYLMFESKDITGFSNESDQECCVNIFIKGNIFA